jgi:hypothetical protein
MLFEMLMADKIACDLHGVIDTNPRLFAALFRVLKQAGKSIYIVSGPPESQIRAELKEAGLIEWSHYSGIYSVVDYLKSKDVKMWLDEKNTWWASDEDWWISKGEICRAIRADIMIDDHIKFKQGFPEGHPTLFLPYHRPTEKELPNDNLVHI